MKNNNSFDEFQWEIFFREEEKNVRAYMEELPKYIHLPGEDIILTGQIPDPDNCQREYCDDCDGNQESENFFKEEYEEPVIEKIIELSRGWLLIQNAALCEKEKALGLKAIALLAIASGRLFAILDTAAEESPGFTIAHCKRLRLELSKCEEIMRKINNHAPHLKKIIGGKISILAEISEFASDKIFEMRKKNTTHN